ncbi:MAG TPA: polysaccharide biosynthesis C-terminal domain-containing protein [Lentimicrobium sp.]|nr:polysaccharide biosynthesis C-terminal domain-containing protein [Lentimicrobium sp.]
MLKNLLSTTASRLIIAFFNLGIVWISARFMGAEILGTISLIILGISIIQLVTSILAGSSLVYQVSRHPIAELLIIAWAWIIIGGIPVWAILVLLDLIPAGFTIDVYILAMLGSIITINQNIFLGKEKVNLFNLMAVLQSVLVLVPMLYFVILKNWIDTSAYVASQYVSMGACSLIGVIMNIPRLKDFKIPKRFVIREAFKFGGFLQAASIMQLFNYRLSYYLIEKFFDRATLGIFSLGVQIAESVWIISKSMAVLLYSRLSNNRDGEYAVNLTISFIKATTFITLFMLLVIIVLPKEFFALIFQKEFSSITTVIGSLSIGIMAMAISLMYSHFFSGTGRPVYNTISSGLGLILTILSGFTLIPIMGLIGAGFTASISYLGSMIYQVIMFSKVTGIKSRDYIPVKSDISKVMKEVKTLV